MLTCPRSCLKQPSSLFFAVLFCLAQVAPAAATTVLDVRDGSTSTVKISLKDPTRIRVDGGRRISDLFGSSVRTSDNPAGGLIVQPDKTKGEIYVQPTSALAHGKATSIFVATEQATYTLVLIPLDIPADTVVLRDRTPAAASGAPASSNFKSPAHFREVKRLLKAMASDTVPADVTVRETTTVIPLWQEAHYVLTRTYENGGRWIGQYYRLTNISDKPMVLDEREFYDGSQIAAIAVDPPELAPGQTANVLIVREAQP